MNFSEWKMSYKEHKIVTPQNPALMDLTEDPKGSYAQVGYHDCVWETKSKPTPEQLRRLLNHAKYFADVAVEQGLDMSTKSAMQQICDAIYGFTHESAVHFCRTAPKSIFDLSVGDWVFHLSHFKQSMDYKDCFIGSIKKGQEFWAEAQSEPVSIDSNPKTVEQGPSTATEDKITLQETAAMFAMAAKRRGEVIAEPLRECIICHKTTTAIFWQEASEGFHSLVYGTCSLHKDTSQTKKIINMLCQERENRVN